MDVWWFAGVGAVQPRGARVPQTASLRSRGEGGLHATQLHAHGARLDGRVRGE